MAACKVDPDASPEFAILRKHWKKKGYRSVFSDLEAAFKEISKDVAACDRRTAQRTSAILQKAAPNRNLLLYKYRYKNTASREGASGGWRVYAIFDKDAGILYPIIAYPHKELSDASEDDIKLGVNEILEILRQRDLPSNS